MIVKGKSVYLRTVRATDLDTLYLFDCDLEARGPYFPASIPSASGFKERFKETGFWTEDYGRVLICDLDENLLGVLFYFKTVPYADGYEIGYRLFDPTQSGRGIMTEALMLCTYALFAIRHIKRLELRIVPENTGSIRVAQKCGYVREGLMRGAIFLRGAYYDMEVYSILREEAPASLAEALARLEG